MKRGAILAIVMILSFMLSCLASYAAEPLTDFSSASNIRIATDEVSPEPVEPGQDVTVKVRIYNQGAATAENVNVNLNAQYPFYLKTESQDFKDYEDICAGCSKDNSYYLVVDANAVSGIYPIKFTATIDGKAKVEKEVSIRVTGVPDLIFESDAVTRLVKPNDIFTADMTLTNIGTGKARNIKVTTSSDDFILLGSGLELIDELKPGRSTNTALEFSVGDEVIPDSYNVPILFDFTDENGAEHNMTQNLGVKLANYGEVYLQNVKTTPSQVNVGEAFTLQVRVENVGTGDAKNVKAVLESSFGGAKEAFIGRLEKDDDAPGIFTLTALGPGNINNKLTITYTDDFGEHEVIEHFSTNVGIKSKPLGLFIAVMIIITLGLAYLLFFRKHRLHNLEK